MVALAVSGVLLASGSDVSDPGLWTSNFGPWGLVTFVIVVGGCTVVGWLVRRLAKIEAKNDKLNEALIETSGMLVPIAEQMKLVLEANTRELERRRERT